MRGLECSRSWARRIGFVAVAVAMACGGGDGKESSSGAGPEDSPVAVGEFLHEAPDECDDGKDNDGDEFTDCDDLDCRADSDSCDRVA